MLLLLGTGLGLNTAPMVSAAMAAAPATRQSLAAAANNTARQIGSVFGVAVLGSLAGDPEAEGFVDGFHRAALVAATLWTLAAVLATRTNTPSASIDQPRSDRPQTGSTVR